MMTVRIVTLLFVALTWPSTIRGQAPASTTLTVPTFGTVTLYQPTTTPTQVVLFLSGDGGWNLGVVPMAEMLRREGALVVGIDIRTFMKNLDAGPSCVYPAGPLEELSRAVQQHAKLPFYHPPSSSGIRPARRWRMRHWRARHPRHSRAPSAWGSAPIWI